MCHDLEKRNPLRNRGIELSWSSRSKRYKCKGDPTHTSRAVFCRNSYGKISTCLLSLSGDDKNEGGDDPGH